MNWYLFALFCEGLVALLIVFGMMLYVGVQYAIAEKKAKTAVNVAEEICEKNVGRIIATIGDETKDLMDYAMDKTQEMVKKTFSNEDES